ncbi:hypothetical protein ACFYXF_03555 [Streptomyces sp. NPDC002680]|uniref:hypothetical protein n=1 Tax=Streptomyces sp. NPDC002680 TaxID=3364659 RepID=UPI003694AB14
MKTSSGLGQTFRRAAADYLFTPDRLLPDRARSPSVNMSAARVNAAEPSGQEPPSTEADEATVGIPHAQDRSRSTVV